MVTPGRYRMLERTKCRSLWMQEAEMLKTKAREGNRERELELSGSDRTPDGELAPSRLHRASRRPEDFVRE